MATVLERLNDILDEKKEKIIPENIKAGVKIFDIEGTMVGGAEIGYIETPWGDIKNYALQKAGLIPTNILGVYISVSRLYTYKDDNDAIYYYMDLDIYNDGTTYVTHMYADRTLTLYDAEDNVLYSDFSVENYIPNAGMKTGTGCEGNSYSTTVNPNFAKATRLVWEFDLSTVKDIT